ncbi:MAG: hypothetical protein AAFY38_00955 [Pseudomonadota bacterium]
MSDDMSKLRVTRANLPAGAKGLCSFDAPMEILTIRIAARLLDEPGPVTAEITGDSTTATASVDGRHWIGDDIWRPIGTYVWTRTRAGAAWQVTSMTFTLTQEVGDRSLAAQAMERATAQIEDPA